MVTRAQLELYRSDRTEVLVDELARVLETPPGDPFTPECLVVQSRGMATWLNQQLAQRHREIKLRIRPIGIGAEGIDS